MDDSLYDEFGNFIGDANDSDAESGVAADDAAGYIDDVDDFIDDIAGAHEAEAMQVDDAPVTTVVLHEDKQYYPAASEVYGADVEAVTHEEDTQPLSEPIIAPIKTKRFTIEEADLPPVLFSREYAADLMAFPEQLRNVAIVGHMHHGKTMLMDMLVTETHLLRAPEGKRQDEQVRYTDTHVLERNRGLSIKSAAMSLLLGSSKGKTHLVNVIDTPGHVNFVDEVASSLRLVDGVVLVVDVVEGVMINTRQVLQHALQERIPITLVVNKIDRLILELKLPPADAYYKIRYCIEQVNACITELMPGSRVRLSPELGNVCLASASLGWCFSLASFAQMYSGFYGGINADEFAPRLWGDVYYNKTSRKFSRKPIDREYVRSFVHFVLEPLYKLVGHTIGEDRQQLAKLLGKLGIFLKPADYKLNSRPLLKIVSEKFFGSSVGLVDMIVAHVPSPVDAAADRIGSIYTGPLDTKVAEALQACDQAGPAVVQVTKLFATSDASDFYAFGRVFSGTLRKGQQVRVLGEAFSLMDEEDMSHATVSELFIDQARYRVAVDAVPAGNLALIGGISASIVKTATLVPEGLREDPYIFRPIKHMSQSVFKVAVEPVNPSELPKMLDGLRKVNKTYPLLETKVEESGEHIVLGTGELYMDCVLHDLRVLYSEIEIKVSDPVTRFCETVYDTSAVQLFTETANKKNKISIVAEPLDPEIGRDIENGEVDINWPAKRVGAFFEKKYDWDIMAARSIWSFGPDDTGANILQDDTLSSEVDKKLLGLVRESVKQGFQWAVREGPLCEEPIRDTRFKIMGAEISANQMFRGGQQIIPTTRRACYLSFLLANPRLMEPLYACHVTGPAECVPALYTVLQKRRGYVLKDTPIPGTPLYYINGELPVIDSFGFETDLRVATQGQAMCSLVFQKWQVVPGDPLDKDAKVLPLQSATGQALARDFVLKTRRRKGLSDEPTVTKYLDKSMDLSVLENL
ncbi:P-loop containing nucleoside triphosphate hydrolase protein [Dipodascopsis tothii]|uniref:P-loop containing nucleoside triphosphate hydrolase protein n=1 Tax=Dipodascopsis tothii TaxID=44089 RepID=UPI0034CFE102